MSYFTSKSADFSQPNVLGKCSRPDVANAIKPQYTQLVGNSRPDALPIVYSDVYNIGFLGVWPSPTALPSASDTLQPVAGITAVNPKHN